MEIETNITKQTKFINAVGKLFEIRNNERKEVKNFWTMDNSNCCLIEGKSNLMKDLLKPFFDCEDSERKKPDINYTDKSGNTSKYSTHFLKSIMDIFSVFNVCSISIAGDFPATFENEHIKIILAPRVDN